MKKGRLIFVLLGTDHDSYSTRRKSIAYDSVDVIVFIRVPSLFLALSSTKVHFFVASTKNAQEKQMPRASRKTSASERRIGEEEEVRISR